MKDLDHHMLTQTFKLDSLELLSNLKFQLSLKFRDPLAILKIIEALLEKSHKLSKYHIICQIKLTIELKVQELKWLKNNGIDLLHSNILNNLFLKIKIGKLFSNKLTNNTSKN
jgi:hypothetical protein